MNNQSLRLVKAKQLRLKTIPFFPSEKEELPQAGFEQSQLSWVGQIFLYMTDVLYDV